MRARNLLALAIALWLTGCGSLINVSTESDIYGGVSTNLRYMSAPPLPQDEVGWWWGVDLPFTAALDTFLLPVCALDTLFDYLRPQMDPDGDSGQSAEERREARRNRLTRGVTGSTAPARPAPVRLRSRSSNRTGRVNPLQ